MGPRSGSARRIAGPWAGVGFQWLREKPCSHGRTMKEVAELLEGMKAAGVIRDYAVFGAIAQMRYTEPMATLDADTLVMPTQDSGLDALSPFSAHSPKRPSDRRRQAKSKGSRCAWCLLRIWA